MTVVVAMQYLQVAAKDPGGGMPKVPDTMLQVLAASHGIYLAGKGWSFFKSNP
jgi:hypothetical protein